MRENAQNRAFFLSARFPDQPIKTQIRPYVHLPNYLLRKLSAGRSPIPDRSALKLPHQPKRQQTQQTQQTQHNQRPEPSEPSERINIYNNAISQATVRTIPNNERRTRRTYRTAGARHNRNEQANRRTNTTSPDERTKTKPYAPLIRTGGEDTHSRKIHWIFLFEVIV